MTTSPISFEMGCSFERGPAQLMTFPSKEPISHRMAEAFRTALPLPFQLESGLDAALRHLLDHPGSLVRPQMIYQLAVDYGFDTQAATHLAIALEYFHTASLVFDDLPCMDDAEERRGVACVHVRFGDSGAILAGLALINRAYALFWRAIAQCPASIQSRAVEYLERRLGVEGLLNGQSLDLNYSSLPHDRSTTERIAYGKTVSLIRLTLVLPAILGGASARELQLLERLSTCWGLGYQTADDLKDITQAAAQSGKTAGRDLHLDRPNIAHAIGVPAAVQRLKRLIGAGDRTFQTLLARRPSLHFIGRLRAGLQDELSRITNHTHEVPGSARL